MCPKCGKIYHANQIRGGSSEPTCPDCNVPLVHAYVGAPVPVGTISVWKISKAPANASNYLIRPTSELAGGILCPITNNYIALTPLRSARPLATLVRKCPYPDIDCKYAKQVENVRVCTYGTKGDMYRVLFGMRGNLRYLPLQPSTALTKSFVVTIFDVFDQPPPKDITKDFNDNLASQLGGPRGSTWFDWVAIGDVEVEELLLFYLVGHSYASKYNRVPVMVLDDNKMPWFLGRKLKTRGVIFRLNLQRAAATINQLRETIMRGSDARTLAMIIAHSLSHVMMKSLAQLTGLSFNEIGESIYIQLEDPDKLDPSNSTIDILIYDNSPNGVGAAEAVNNALSDYVNYVVRNSGPCPRYCKMACKACLYLENCAMLNFRLSWMASYIYLRK